jgi:hypothetical protein
VWFFAYEDGSGQYPPKPKEKAHKVLTLPAAIWREKYRIVTELYGFSPDSFEAKSASNKEAFWCFRSPSRLHQWSR